jgi:glycosyltransferase involved in cell wall biosynthesis
MHQKAIIVLGMHRSGTSVATRILNMLGAEVAANLMQPTAENPSGYWESENVAKFNNRLLHLANSTWKTDTPLPENLFEQASFVALQQEAIELINSEFPTARTFVLKCPRLCLLLPFWRIVLKKANIDPFVLMIVRNPEKVAVSLAARMDFPTMKAAAINTPEKSALLWLRYVLDAEKHSRCLPRIVITYEDLVINWEKTLSPILQGFIPEFPIISPIPDIEITALLKPANRRKKIDSPENFTRFFNDHKTIFDLVIKLLLNNQPETYNTIDAVKREFDRLIKTYFPLREMHSNIPGLDVWASEIIMELETITDAIRFSSFNYLNEKSILFLSDVPAQNIGQIFRVQMHRKVLEDFGVKTYYCRTDDQNAETLLESSSMVVIFRTEWNQYLVNIKKICEKNKIPLVYAVDDVLFEPKFMTPEHFNLLSNKSSGFIETWISSANRHNETLLNCDTAILSTKPLADYASKYCPKVYVLPNMIDEELYGYAKYALSASKQKTPEPGLLIGFTSGTRTHNQNFGHIIPALATVLQKHPEVKLQIIGSLDIDTKGLLSPFLQRITIKQPVEIEQLFMEINSFDINLFPLEVGNPFCETKSELRYVFASLLKIPTVASPVKPIKDFIQHGETGFLANTTSDWVNYLSLLIEDENLRHNIGQKAHIQTLARLGPEALVSKTYYVYNDIMSCFSNI